MPAQIVGVEETPRCGDRGTGRFCTSHVERMNLSIRVGLRRFTRPTNCYGRKWENHAAMLALYLAWFNFCRRHETVKTTPAVAHGIASEVWSVERLLTEAA